jgi:hypothetical protein
LTHFGAAVSSGFCRTTVFLACPSRRYQLSFFRGIIEKFFLQRCRRIFAIVRGYYRLRAGLRHSGFLGFLARCPFLESPTSLPPFLLLFSFSRRSRSFLFSLFYLTCDLLGRQGFHPRPFLRQPGTLDDLQDIVLLKCFEIIFVISLSAHHSICHDLTDNRSLKFRGQLLDISLPAHL